MGDLDSKGGMVGKILATHFSNKTSCLFSLISAHLSICQLWNKFYLCSQIYIELIQLPDKLKQ